MNSRVSWSVEGIDPSVRERAEAAARRAGMSLNDWLNSTLGNSAPPDFRSPYDQPAAMPSQEAPDVADIHQRLDSITRQIEQISQPKPRSDVPRSDMPRNDLPRCDAPRSDVPRGEPGVARQLNDAISRLDARLSQISNPAAATGPIPGQAAPGRDGRARRQPGVSPLAAAQPGVVRFCDRGNRRAPERTRCSRTAVDAAAQRAAQNGLPWRPPCRWRPRCSRRRRPARIFPRWSGICSRSPARSRRCSAPTGSSNRSPRSAPSLRKFAPPSPRRCRAGRSNRSRTKSARCRAASTTPARAAPTARRWPASNARSPKFARSCAR